jgi:hypothetical protein
VATADEKLLVGTWLHAHEEDTGTEAVYRPADFEFPPARGRRGYEFRPDHTGAYIGIAARDGAARTSCKWRLRKKRGGVEVELTFDDGRKEVLRVASLDKKRLVLRKPAE